MDRCDAEAQTAQRVTCSGQLVEELAQAVGEQMAFQTSRAVEEAWQRGAQEIEWMQQRGAEQRSELEQQLEACAEAQRSAQRDGARLQDVADALTQRLPAAPLGPPSEAPGLSRVAEPAAAVAEMPVAMPAPPCDEPWSIPMMGTPPSRFAAGFYGHSPGDDVAASSPDKDELVREVTSAVKEQIQRNTESAMDALWQKGEKVFHKLQQEQTAHMARLQSQVLQCTEAQQRIHQDNAQLRRSLEALVLRLQSQVGPSAPLRPESRPFYPPGVPASLGAAQAAPCRSASDPTSGDGFAPPGIAQAGDDAAANSEMKWVPKSTVSITLRRADDVSLGLDLEGETGGSFLCVRGLRPGGAVESWNRLNQGTDRAIRTGDRIIQVNDAEEVDAMLDNCRQRLLLRLLVQRGSYERAAASS